MSYQQYHVKSFVHKLKPQSRLSSLREQYIHLIRSINKCRFKVCRRSFASTIWSPSTFLLLSKTSGSSSNLWTSLTPLRRVLSLLEIQNLEKGHDQIILWFNHLKSLGIQTNFKVGTIAATKSLETQENRLKQQNQAEAKIINQAVKEAVQKSKVQFMKIIPKIDRGDVQFMIKQQLKQAGFATQSSFKKPFDQLKAAVDSLESKKVDQAQLQKLKQVMASQNAKNGEYNNSFSVVMKKLQVIEKIDWKPEITQLRTLISGSIQDFQNKLKKRAQISDLIKLQDLMLQLIDHTTKMLVKKTADRGETRKALIFLQRRINKVVAHMFGDTSEPEKDAILAAKGWKCVSCAKDLDKFQGKLDKFKPWSIFPAKEIKPEKWTGFGQGFQTKVEQLAHKKGLPIRFDDKGKMTTPYDLTREVNVSIDRKLQRIGSGKNLTSSNLKSDFNSYESNFMKDFGKSPQSYPCVSREYFDSMQGIEKMMRPVKKVEAKEPEEEDNPSPIYN